MTLTNTSKLLLAFFSALPAILLRATHTELLPEWSLLVFGAAILASAFILTWAAECSEKDISGGLAIAILALIAVLPEYAVDLYFAFTAGTNPEHGPYAIANMTGSNRLLLGLGWPVVIALLVWKKGGFKKGFLSGSVVLSKNTRFALLTLLAASIYAFIIPFLGRVSIFDTIVLFSIFAFYLWHLAKEEHAEPELIGVAAEIASFRHKRRIITVICFFVFAAVAILASAEPFAESLIATGRRFRINEFLLVQWLAPLASETTEFLVAIMLALRGKQEASFGTLLSSKINQWTLLVGSIPIAYILGGGGSALVLDFRQNQEVLLTAAQSLLGLAIVINLRVSVGEAILLFGLFFIQFFIPLPQSRMIVSVIYLTLTAIIVLRDRRSICEIYGTWLNSGKIAKIFTRR